jgi:RNA polymerase sigma-70 factor (ECF subfamily)
LVVAFQKVDTLRSEASFLSFLFSISVRLLANNKRKKKEEVGFSTEFLASFPDQNAQTDLDADVSFLHEALLCLPEEQREAIILFEISGFNLKEISDMQEVSLSAVKQRLRRGRIKLTEVLTFVSQTKKEVCNER